MAFINQALAHGAAVVARQATTAITSIASSSVTPSPTSGTPTVVSSTPTSSPSTSPTDNGMTGPGNNNNNNNNGNNSQSSPLLFFVALGFGVVFTNLWIIVGVKYCFRYNARSRQMRLNEDGEPITLENMPRPHRRRREKKLMTMEEVNEKFPMLKYKNWVASRVQEGLPAQGGVSAPPSRANSVRSVEGIIPELPPKERESTDERPATSAAKEKPVATHEAKDSTADTVASANAVNAEQPATTEGQPSAAVTSPTRPTPTARASDDHDRSEDEEDDEHINAALPPECLAVAGDTCAICIDALEDDDDVRGLTCGHAFHAVCLDPWLTSRRACCPLCKADYYTPKPRPPVPEGETTAGVIAVSLSDGRQRMNMPSRPQNTWISFRGNGRMFPARLMMMRGTDDAPSRQPREAAPSSRRLPFFGRSRTTQPPPRREATSPTTTTQPAPQTGSAAESGGGSWFSNIRTGLPQVSLNHFRRHRGQSQNDNSAPMSGANPASVTPSRLEAGVGAGAGMRH